MEPVYPSLGTRIQALFIDGVLIIVLMFVFSAFLPDEAPAWVRIALFLGLWLVYEPVCTAFGCTLGSYMKNIRVRQNDDETRKIGLLQAYIRYAVKTCLGWFSFFTIHSNPRRRAIHDLAAGSVMVIKDSKLANEF